MQLGIQPFQCSAEIPNEDDIPVAIAAQHAGWPERLVIVRKDDFPALHREFKSSIFSWHWIESEPGHSAVAKETEQPAAR